MFNKVVDILISLRGDSKSMRYVVTLHTHYTQHTTYTIYILISEMAQSPYFIFPSDIQERIDEQKSFKKDYLLR